MTRPCRAKYARGVDAGHGFIGVGEPNMTVKDYIIETFPKTLRNAVKDEDTLLGLPYPYTVPCAESYLTNCFIGILILLIKLLS